MRVIARRLAEDSEGGRWQAQRAESEAGTVERVKHLGAKIEPETFVDRNRLRDRNVLVVVGVVPEFGVIASHVANDVGGLRWEEAGRLDGTILARIEIAAGTSWLPAIV